ncbi:MAG: glycerophosphodiester phosphodiesterase [Armatimonadetes bacterium]|nr:glycerophosphodiester phosphodiesterase [Armatimonadota bacterium]
MPLGPTTAFVADSWTSTQVVGHRGAAAYAPENSLESFAAAIDSGVRAAECDVHVSANGDVMVIHDSTLDRTTSLTGAVAQTPSWEMIEAGVPTLDQLCDAVKGRLILVVEIKGGDGIEQLVVDSLAEYEMLDSSIVFSFSGDSVARVKSLEPRLYCVWLVGDNALSKEPEGALRSKLDQFQADAVGFSFYGVNKVLTTYLRGEKIPLFVWTIPPGPGVAQLQSLRVNFIITNHPRDVLAQLSEHTTQR